MIQFDYYLSNGLKPPTSCTLVYILDPHYLDLDSMIFGTTPQELQSIRLRHHVKPFSATTVTSGGWVAMGKNAFTMSHWGEIFILFAIFESKVGGGIL